LRKTISCVMRCRNGVMAYPCVEIGIVPRQGCLRRV